MIVGVGMVAIFAPAADSATWSLWGAVGESFGALNAIFSGLALAALVVTFWLQFKELRSQRMELSLQRESLIQSHQELHRAAEVNIRHLRLNLRIGSHEEIESEIRYVFGNPIMRMYWMETAPARSTLLEPDSEETRFWRLATDVCNEYEAVLSKARRHDAGASGTNPTMVAGDDSHREAA